MFCSKCGAQLDDGTQFCPNCGTPMGGAPVQQPAAPAELLYTSDEDVALMTEGERTLLIRAVAVICYITPFFLFPCFVLKDKKFVRAHANNGILLAIFGAGVGTLSWIPIAGWLLALAFAVYSVVMAVMGIIRAVRGVSFRMPILGGIKILK